MGQSIPQFGDDARGKSSHLEAMFAKKEMCFIGLGRDFEDTCISAHFSVIVPSHVSNLSFYTPLVPELESTRSRCTSLQLEVFGFGARNWFVRSLLLSLLGAIVYRLATLLRQI